MNRTATEWLVILRKCRVRQSTARLWAPIFAAVIVDGAFNKGDAELDDFLGQVLHESTFLQKLEEGLIYSTPGRLMHVWRTRFKTLESELPYMGNPEALANYVYGGRMGNSRPGDGWRNRGSGLIQITGANNLRAVQEATGIPVYDYPDLLRQPTEENLRVCIAWWEGNIPDSAIGNVLRETQIVNNGTNGLPDREFLTKLAQEALAA